MKIKFFRKTLLQFVEPSPQLIFSGDGVNAGDVVDSLMKMHPDESLGGDGVVSPAKIPVSLLGLADNFEANFEGGFSDNRVFSDLVRK